MGDAITTKRRNKPEAVRDMARRRGLSIKKAKRGGWYVMLAGAPWDGILYYSHSWSYITNFVFDQPRIIKVGDT